MKREAATFEVGIEAIAYRLGSRVETGADLARDNPGWNVDEIERKTGVRTRHLAAAGETAADIAAAAARDLLDRGVDAARIGALIFVTQSPDHLLPTTACLLQDRLGLPKTCIAFDINQGCSGFVYGLGVSASLIHSGLADRVLLLCADTYSRYIGADDRACRPLFSDGAAATLITRQGGASMGPFVFGTDGSGAANLIVKGGGARDAGSEQASPPRLEMKGSQVFMFTMSAVPKVVHSLLEAGDVPVDGVDLFVFHQASAIVLDNIGRHLKLPPGKMYSNLERVGNTVSASIPIALADALEEKRLRDGQTVLLCGFGVGFSWGGVLLRWGAGHA
jgi:3-oxoacyl-[acyl-carrier-protein] synthase III